jgi:hypothetical protein
MEQRGAEGRLFSCVGRMTSGDSVAKPALVGANGIRLGCLSRVVFSGNASLQAYAACSVA